MLKEKLEKLKSIEYMVFENKEKLKDNKTGLKRADTVRHMIESNLVLLLEAVDSKLRFKDYEASIMLLVDNTDDFTEDDINGLKKINDELVKLLSKRIFKDALTDTIHK